MKKTIKHPCQNCVYFAACGESSRTVQCDGRQTKSEKKRENKGGEIEIGF